ncbi:MAG: TetR/AcrR family transcriptional regulator [Chloroflexaceae bacterium]|jgi:AcrR family transcriptional regulator|nr:TetR/AcrR family transcriptional regulator [Chloroflexaceae bacterium]
MKTTTPSLEPRERILQTATRLFYSQGYHTTGINQIIAEAQVAKASFYDHFPSKDALAVAYLQRTQADRMQRMRACVEATPEPRRRVLALFDFLRQWMLDHAYRGCQSLNLLPEFPDPTHVVHRQIAAHKANLRAFVHELVEAAHRQQPLARPVDVTADRIYLLYEGAVVESALVRDAWPIAVAQQAAADMLSETLV